MINRGDEPNTAVNDARVRKKLSFWLKTIGDVDLIIENLPEDQSRKIVQDMDIFLLIALIEKLMRLKKFGAIEMDSDDKLTWTVSTDGIMKKPAQNSDIIRAYAVLCMIKNLQHQLSPVTSPVPMAALLSEMDKQPEGRDRVTGKDRIVVERYDKAIDEFKKQIRDWKEKQMRSIEGEEPPK